MSFYTNKSTRYMTGPICLDNYIRKKKHANENIIQSFPITGQLHNTPGEYVYTINDFFFIVNL